MRATVERMRQHADEFGERDAADREFHVRIAAATGNGSLALVVEGLWQQRRGKLWSRIEAYFHTQKMRDGVLRDHTAIIDALEAHDPDGARGGDAQASRARRARVPAAMGRDRPGEEEQAGARRTAAMRKRNATRSRQRNEGGCQNEHERSCR